jgi:hypothetical protein
MVDSICPTRRFRLLRMMNSQLELVFGQTQECRSVARRQRARRRTQRAQWWFNRMREAVDRALDRVPAAAPRPEQLVFEGAHRLALAPAGTDERQICE